LEVYRELLFSSLFLLLRVQGLLQRTLLQFDLVN
jgi:predicted DNA-binding transcriptional regulator